MRILALIALVIMFPCAGIAQNKIAREETIKLLREQLTQHHSVADKKTNADNSTAICLNVNERKTDGDLTDRDFSTTIRSSVSWQQDEVEIQNDIFQNGTFTETYNYKVPVGAIVKAWVTNCVKNTTGNINAYRDRPIFIAVKNNTTQISHIIFDNKGKPKNSKGVQQYMNSTPADWDSLIPIAGKGDNHPALMNSTLRAFDRLIALNETRYTLK